jgi:rRNA-processing protein FCF1
VAFYVPATVLGELDRLIQRPEMRAKARAALNVLKGFVDRGRVGQPVSCGERKTITIGLASAERCPDGLDPNYADDRILAAALSLQIDGARVAVASTDFALYVRAISLGLDGKYLPGLAVASSVTPAAQQRAVRSFEQEWERLNRSATPYQILRRIAPIIHSQLGLQLLAAVRVSHEPQGLADALNKFDRFLAAWSQSGDWTTVIAGTLGIQPPPLLDMSVQRLWEAEPTSWNFKPSPGFGAGKWRSETADERAIRLGQEHAAIGERSAFIVDAVRNMIRPVFEWVMQETDAV